jgi:hypothetical protein
MNINILIDVSGSMTENGKDSVVKYLIYALKGYEKEEKRISCRLFQWGNDIEELPDLTKLSFQAGSASEKIVGFIKEHLGEKNLIISDGGFSREIKRGIKGIPERKDIYYIGVGCDCNLPVIRNLAASDRIFLSQDVIACLKNIVDAG